MIILAKIKPQHVSRIDDTSSCQTKGPKFDQKDFSSSLEDANFKELL